MSQLLTMRLKQKDRRQRYRTLWDPTPDDGATALTNADSHTELLAEYALTNLASISDRRSFKLITSCY